MLERNPSNSIKDHRQIDSQKKSYTHSLDSKVRILQYDLVFASGLPSNISSKEILTTDLYFGRYGKVTKIILNPAYPLKKGINYQSYITYEDELNASLAIVSLDGFTLFDRSLKVSYGTTKYCSHFLKGRQCTNDDCFYFHEIVKEREVISGDPRAVFQQQNYRALDIVLNNLQAIAERILCSNIEHLYEGFPSLTQMINFLIQNEYIDQGEYNSIYQKVKKRISNTSSQNKKISSVQSREKKLICNEISAHNISTQKQTKEQQQLPILNQYVPTKLIKSNSFSTMASPSKPQASTQFDDQQKRLNQIDNTQSMKIIYTPERIESKNQELQDRAVRSDDQNTKFYQNLQNFEQRIQDKISQKIIKQIMKKKGIRSRFQFVSLDLKNSDIVQEIKKIKNIIQRFLITYQ